MHIHLLLTIRGGLIFFMKAIKYYFLCILLIISLVVFAQQPIYKNKNHSPEERVRDLLKRMTLDEKIMQMQCLWIQKSRILNDKGDFDETKAALMENLLPIKLF